CDPRRENRAESSGRVAVSHRFPAVTGSRRQRGAGREPPPGLEAQRTGLVIRPKNGDLGRSARLPLRKEPNLPARADANSGKKHGGTGLFVNRQRLDCVVRITTLKSSLHRNIPAFKTPVRGGSG